MLEVEVSVSLGDSSILGDGHGTSGSILGGGHSFSSETLDLHPEAQQSNPFPRQLGSAPFSLVLGGLCCRTWLGKIYRTSLTETYAWLYLKLTAKKYLGSNMKPYLML